MRVGERSRGLELRKVMDGVKSFSGQGKRIQVQMYQNISYVS